ncbi:MAG: glycosyltransferase family 4 protein [Verrucomicrobiae bacterium]|nr:glycosyltransferase family 4 protein [Verrucomicrobiae bacterium]NNJ44006.1 glycosyltransferase family 4 protein [Akkermansiaceae bacterium]
MAEKLPEWIVCQIGAREHYGIARALRRAGCLSGVLTDFWLPPGSMVGSMPGAARLRDRYHRDLDASKVYAPNLRMLGFEGVLRIRSLSGWDGIIKRNHLFQQEALKRLRKWRAPMSGGQTPTLFSYSYAALELFREVKDWGWRTVLGQIDPGPGEDAIVQNLRAAHPEWAEGIEHSPPESYWQDWREECGLADRIMVNSEWSRKLLVAEGIDREKLEVLPLAYDVGRASNCGSHPTFQKKSQLRVLFLGQAIVRKGIQDLVAAARLLTEAPIQIDIVGPHGVLPSGLPSNLVFHGAVPRSEAAQWYQQSDLFVLPTHSDGFALTQLEAMAQGVPVIATPCCGDVVVEGVNGWVVPAGNAQVLAERLRQIAQSPDMLESMRKAAMATAEGFGLERVAQALTQVGTEVVI